MEQCGVLGESLDLFNIHRRYIANVDLHAHKYAGMSVNELQSSAINTMPMFMNKAHCENKGGH